MRVAVAFATEAGVKTLRKEIGAAPFDHADKQWLIGIQDGITQPRALQTLRSHGASEVRVPFGSEVIGDPVLRGPSFFHPKVYYMENSSTKQVQLVSTSANLTLGGLTSNVEQFLIWSGTRADPSAQAFREWWDTIWPGADSADDAFVDAYEAVRPKLPTAKGASAANPPVVDLTGATTFWIELTRRPEGASYNQIELLFNGHHFFYPDLEAPPRHPHRPLVFEDRFGNVYDSPGRRIMFNGPPGKPKGNSMWRVYMPTSTEGFSDYQDGDVLVRFERTQDRDRYIIDATPSNSPAALGWIESSQVVQHPGPPPHRMGWS